MHRAKGDRFVHASELPVCDNDARLRTTCCPLRRLLYSTNIVDILYWTCGDTEDSHHFLFVCHQVTDMRQYLINQCQIAVSLILTFYSVVIYY